MKMTAMLITGLFLTKPEYVLLNVHDTPMTGISAKIPSGHCQRQQTSVRKGAVMDDKS